VVARGHHLYAHLEQVQGELRSNPKTARGILDIGDCQVNLLFGHNPRKLPGDNIASG
jgi:hypothetical protein